MSNNSIINIVFNKHPFTLLSLFKKNKEAYEITLPSVCVCVCVCVSLPINVWTPEPIFMKLGTDITAPEPISSAQLNDPSYQSVCLYLYPLIVAR
jgi:hypothetical protein